MSEHLGRYDYDVGSRRLTAENVKAAYEETGTTPKRGLFQRELDSGNGTPTACGCGIGVVAKSLDSSADSAWQLLMNCGYSQSYLEGFVKGFDAIGETDPMTLARGIALRLAQEGKDLYEMGGLEYALAQGRETRNAIYVGVLDGLKVAAEVFDGSEAYSGYATEEEAIQAPQLQFVFLRGEA